ncbi:MAG: class I SAM-dependent methyltransferase [Chloroflexi bacterium]|jgi:ubiquinone/menaquinone biosynthesis C-methylase UbiE|nr:class I SAM-dependent methyltransferase [Chloroflexota bacterium]
MMQTYQEYAKVYDRSGQLAFSLKMIRYLNTLLERYPLEGRRLLELACGTGTVAAAMASAGWQVYGVDGSAAMLEEARAKAAAAGVSVAFSQQDMRSFRLDERVHLATCLYDSMNYMLSSEELLAVFRRVYAALEPGGLFFFDMNTAYALEVLWDDEVHYSDEPDITVIFRSRYDQRRQRITVVATVFDRQGELYRKIQEEHTEQAYPLEQVATLLTDVGFHVEAYYDCFSLLPADDETFRIMWVARKGGAAARPDEGR